MDPSQLIAKYYKDLPKAHAIIKEHSRAVAGKAVNVARIAGLPDEEILFIEESALLHDIGILFTDAEELGCHGHLPYISHGYKGHDLLVREGFPKHALVCERHTGTGLTLSDIDNQKLDIPRRPMEPVSIAEKIICYCDKFFSKEPGFLTVEKSVGEVIARIGAYGKDKELIFIEWHNQFGK